MNGFHGYQDPMVSGHFGGWIVIVILAVCALFVLWSKLGKWAKVCAATALAVGCAIFALAFPW
jgi:uncharacterized membrane protein